MPFTCKELLDGGFEFDLIITIGGYDLELNAPQLLLDSSLYANNNEGACYLALTSETDSPFGNNWVLGAWVMRHYYTVYDTSEQDAQIVSGMSKTTNSIWIAPAHENVVNLDEGTSDSRGSMMWFFYSLLAVLLFSGGIYAYCIYVEQQSLKR